MKCPFDQNAILRDIDELPVNLALLQLVGAAVPDGGGDGESGEPGDGFGYYSVKKRIEDLALYLKPATTSAGETGTCFKSYLLYRCQHYCFRAENHAFRGPSRIPAFHFKRPAFWRISH